MFIFRSLFILIAITVEIILYLFSSDDILSSVCLFKHTVSTPRDLELTIIFCYLFKRDRINKELFLFFLICDLRLDSVFFKTYRIVTILNRKKKWREKKWSELRESESEREREGDKLTATASTITLAWTCCLPFSIWPLSLTSVLISGFGPRYLYVSVS